MNKGRSIRLDQLLLICFSLILILTRFLHLNARPLTDYEAVHALDAAWDFHSGSSSEASAGSIAPQSPLYYYLTHQLFEFVGESDSIARAVPAIGGTLLLLSIGVLWHRGKSGLRLIWLLLLGFSTVVSTVSRTAGGEMLAAATVITILLLVLPEIQPKPKHSSILLAIVVGASLTTGSGVFRALSGLFLTGLLAMIAQRDRFGSWVRKTFSPGALKSSWLIPVTTVVILSGFGTSLAGFRGFATSLEAWLLGWTQSSGTSFFELVVLLVTTEPVILFFSIAGVIKIWRDQALSGWIAAFWALGSGIFLLVYPGRSPSDLLWIILPLSYLAAFAIATLLQSIGSQSSKQELLGLVAILAIFLASGALSLVAYATGNVVTINPANPYLLVFLFLALGIMGLSVLVFFGIGWSWSIVAHAIGIFFLLIGILQGIASTWRLNFSQDGYQVSSLWWQVVPSEGLPIAVKTLQQTALAYSGQPDDLTIEIRSELPSSLIWAFREYEKVDDTSTFFGLEASPVILVREEEVQADFSADYIGESLGLRNQKAWDSPLPPQFFRWLITGTAPHNTERWVIWVRVDIASFGDIGLEG